MNPFKWFFKPVRCKVGTHNYMKETVIRDDRTVIMRLQCQDCPHHTDGWNFGKPRQAKIARFR